MKYAKRILAVLLALFMLMNGAAVAYADFEDGKECPECGKYRWDDWIACEDCGICIDCAADYTCPYCGGCTYCAGDWCNGCGACPDCGESCKECETLDQCGDCLRCADCVALCAGCGEICADCADAWCGNCGTCGDCNGDTGCPTCGNTCESCGNEDQCTTCHTCAACADICLNCGDFCSMCDLDYNETAHLCGNCDVHDATANGVIAKIAAIGTVEFTPECKAKIDAATAAFRALSAEQQALVTNFGTLRAAQARYTQLKKQEDSRKARIVINGINNIGTVQYDSTSRKKIAIGKKLYAALTADQKALVDNYDLLTAAEARYNELRQAAADQSAANDVIGRISAIGTVACTDATALKIGRARTAYNALTDAQKALVTNYAVLTAAEEKYAQLQAAANQTAEEKAAVLNAAQKIGAIGKVEFTPECKAKIDAARAAYNALSDAQKTLVTNYAVLTAAEAKYAALKAVHTVTAAIDAIGTVAYTAESKAKIDAARSAYNALTDAQKSRIANYKTLTSAEAEYAKLKAAADLAAADQAAANAVSAKIGAIGTVAYTAGSKEKIDAARDAYNALTYKQKTLVKNYASLTAAEAKYAELKKAADDKAAADAVIAKIDAIGTVAYTAESRKKINDARVAYHALTDAQKALVTNYVAFTAAEAVYETLKAAAEGPGADFRRGDVNADGKITTADARFALRKAVDLETYAPDSRDFLACDVDRSGTVTTGDARHILRAAVGLEDPATW